MKMHLKCQYLHYIQTYFTENLTKNKICLFSFNVCEQFNTIYIYETSNRKLRRAELQIIRRVPLTLSGSEFRIFYDGENKKGGKTSRSYVRSKTFAGR